jgi:hypothetical protein
MMERNIRVLSPDVLLEEYRELLEDERVEALPLLISGNSMSPFLVDGRDTVYLSRLTKPVKKGDVILYQRKNGAYILHRVYKIKNGSFTMLGDAQTEPEEGILPEQIVAVMTSADRKGKKETPGSFWWEFFEKVWIRIPALRPPLRNIYTAASKLLKR